VAYEERCAVLEYNGCLDRQEAEEAAAEELDLPETPPCPHCAGEGCGWCQPDPNDYPEPPLDRDEAEALAAEELDWELPEFLRRKA
jgi:hypothetical protein